MPVRPIVMIPDPRLASPAAEVTSFDAALSSLADDLLDTMRDAPGIGITAPHLGLLRQICPRTPPTTTASLCQGPTLC